MARPHLAGAAQAAKERAPEGALSSFRFRAQLQFVELVQQVEQRRTLIAADTVEQPAFELERHGRDLVVTLLPVRRQPQPAPTARSDDSRHGQECVSTCRTGWSPLTYKKT